MPRRDQRILLGLTALSVLLALLVSLTGINADVLLATPVLILLLPLLAGRYVGEEGIARLGARLVAPRRGAGACMPGRRAAPRPRACCPRGGRLIAAVPGPARPARRWRSSSRAEAGPPAGAPVRRPTSSTSRSLFACSASRAVLAATALIAIAAAPAASPTRATPTTAR